ncbi:MAG: hypothetical protein M1837_000345 [Sclerophora amabilis]|nr:MAG: hypothetical protein M1837_000345 [Sclerophora amabilis]
MAVNETPRARILELPREIRNEIYGYLLLPGPIHIIDHFDFDSLDYQVCKNLLKNGPFKNPTPVCPEFYGAEFERGKLYVSLLKTCRHIYREAVEILYSNTFIIDFDWSRSMRPNAAVVFLRRLQLNTRRALRRIHLRNFRPSLFNWSPSHPGRLAEDENGEMNYWLPQKTSNLEAEEKYAKEFGASVVDICLLAAQTELKEMKISVDMSQFPSQRRPDDLLQLAWFLPFLVLRRKQSIEISFHLGHMDSIADMEYYWQWKKVIDRFLRETQKVMTFGEEMVGTRINYDGLWRHKGPLKGYQAIPHKLTSLSREPSQLFEQERLLPGCGGWFLEGGGEDRMESDEEETVSDFVVLEYFYGILKRPERI